MEKRLKSRPEKIAAFTGHNEDLLRKGIVLKIKRGDIFASVFNEPSLYMKRDTDENNGIGLYQCNHENQDRGGKSDCRVFSNINIELPVVNSFFQGK